MLIKLAGQTALRDSILSAIHVPAAATAAVITLAAVAGKKHWLHSIQWSYSADPTGGRLTVVTGVTTRFDVDITTGGPGGFSLEIVADENEAMVITLASGAGAVVGKINAQYSTERDVLEYI